MGLDDSVNYANMLAAMAARDRAASVPSGAVDGADLSADALATIAASSALIGGFGQLWATPAASTTLTGTLVAWTVTAVDCTAGAGARTLPAASSVVAGTAFVAKKGDTSGNALTVNRSGSDLIFGTGAGSTTKVLTLPGEAVEFVSNGIDRYTVRASDTPSGVLSGTYARLTFTDLLPTRARRVTRLGGETFIYRILPLSTAGTAIAATGPTGMAWKTTDYGRTWVLKAANAGGAANLHDLCDVGGGIILGSTDNASRIARSTDSGETWTASGASVQLDAAILKVNTIIKLSGSNVLLAGTWNNSAGSAKVFRSTDTGLTWDAGQSLGDAKGTNIFLDFGSGIVVAGTQSSTGGVVEWHRSTDYGVNWARLSSAGLGLTSAEFGHCGYVLGNGVAVAGTYGGSGTPHIYRTTDYGVTWTSVDTDTAAGYFDIGQLAPGILMAVTGITNATAHAKISLDNGLTWTLWQQWGGSGATHVFSPVSLGLGTVLLGTGTTGEIWSTGDVSRAPVSISSGSDGIWLWGYNRSGASKPAGTPVILGGISTTTPGQGGDASFYGSASATGDAQTLGVLLDTTANSALGRVLVCGIANVNVTSGAYVPGDSIRTTSDGLNAVVDNSVAAANRLGKVLVGGAAVTTVKALIGPF